MNESGRCSNMVALQYYNAMNNAKALQLLREGLQGDAVTHNAASLFITLNGTEPARLQDTERVFRDAINKSKRADSRARLYRYLVTFNIYTGEAFNQNRAYSNCVVNFCHDILTVVVIPT